MAKLTCFFNTSRKLCNKNQLGATDKSRCTFSKTKNRGNIFRALLQHLLHLFSFLRVIFIQPLLCSFVSSRSSRTENVYFFCRLRFYTQNFISISKHLIVSQKFTIEEFLSGRESFNLSKTPNISVKYVVRFIFSSSLKVGTYLKSTSLFSVGNTFISSWKRHTPFAIPL